MTDQFENRGKFYTVISIVHSLALSITHSLTQIIFLIQEKQRNSVIDFFETLGTGL